MRYVTILLIAVAASAALTSITQGRPITARIASGTLGQAQFVVARCGASPDILADVTNWTGKRGTDVSLAMVEAARASEDRLFMAATDKASWCRDAEARVRDAVSE